MKKENKLVADLTSFDSNVLAEFIASLYGADTFLDSKIERLLLSKDTDKLTKLMKKEIASLKRSQGYIGYYESAGFSNKISELHYEIENNILPKWPDKAFKLTEALLDTAENSLERCDDSNGDIGDAYQNICLLWLKAASMSSAPKSGWTNAVKLLAQDNDYGILDPLLPNAHMLLSEDELRQLAAYYENGLRASLTNKYDCRADFSWSVNLKGVAEALKDPTMYQQATLLVSPSPNYIQMEDMAKFCIGCGAYDQAMKWLEGDWGTAQWDKPNATRLSLLADCYLGLNQQDKRRITLIELLDISPSYKNFQKILPLVSAGEAGQLRVKFIASVLKQSDSYAKLAPLIQLEEYVQAEEIAIKDIDKLANYSYTTLLSLLKLVPEDRHLIRIILLRCLLDDILTRAKTPAYHYGVDYLRELEQLDTKITTYATLPVHADYMLQVKGKHGRKHSFWSKYNTQ